MDFIERLFGIYPDGGSGSLEALYLVVAVLTCAAWLRRRSLARRP